MEKRILIAVDGSIYSRKAIEYTVKMGSVIKELNYTLLNVQPKISEFLIEDARSDSKAHASLKDVTSKNNENSLKILEESKEIMIKQGIKEDQINAVSQPVIRGTAKSILDYAKHSLCDSIVLGRRGVSRITEAFTGSVTNNVLEHASATPVWAIGGQVISPKIMVAIDGSESALKAMDHVIFMLGENPDIQITLLHVTPKLRDFCTIEFDDEGEILEEVISQGSKKCVDSFYTHAMQKAREAGLKESQIDVKEVASTINIGKTIVNEAKKGGFGTVVVGRRGVDDSFFMGKVSRYVLTNASDCAVWLVP